MHAIGEIFKKISILTCLKKYHYTNSMQNYLLNLLPRLKQFSETLDKKEILIDQPWILTGDYPNKQQFIFRRDGKLIQSVGGNVETGTWEYIPAAKSLLIESSSMKVLLNHVFVEKGALLLRKDGSPETPWLLVNERIVPDLDVEKYLKSLVSAKTRQKWIKLESGEEFEYHDEYSIGLGEGTSVSINGAEVRDGIYKTAESNLFLEVRNSTVQQLFRKKEFRTDRGTLTIHLIHGLDPELRKGLEVWSGQYPAHDNRYMFPDNDHPVKYIDVRNGLIKKVRYKNDSTTFVMTLLVIALVAFAVIALMISLRQ